MAQKNSIFLAAVAGLAGGLAVGILVTSRTGLEARAVLGKRMRTGAKRLEYQLKNLENQLRELEHAIQRSTTQFAEHLHGGEGETSTSEGFAVEGDEVVRELPHLPRR